MRYRAEYIQRRITTLRESGHHPEVKKVADSWTKRVSRNNAGFYDPKKAKATV